MADTNSAELAALIAGQLSGMPDDPIDQIRYLRARSVLLDEVKAALAVQRDAITAGLNEHDHLSYAKIAAKVGDLTPSGVQKFVDAHKARTTVTVDVEMETENGGEWELVAGHVFPLTSNAREVAEFAIRVTLGLLPETRDASNAPSRAIRATVCQDGEVLDEIEVGDFVCDADSDKSIRRATWWEQAVSLEAPDGVFEVDGRRVYVG